MKLIFLRHAHSAFNRDSIYQGQYDCELSEKGIEDLKILKNNFNKEYDYCYCSPLKRTRYTAYAVASKESIRYDDRLKEIGLGVWETTPITNGKSEAYRNGFIPEGAETKQEFTERVRTFLEDLREEHKDTDTILIVTHGGIINAIQRLLTTKFSRDIQNLSILEIQFDEYGNMISENYEEFKSTDKVL